MSVEEYLSTSFDDADCEYLDGEVVERNTGEKPHARAQGMLVHRLVEIARKLSLEALPEIRIQIHSRRFRVADIAAWHAAAVGDERIPVVPPFLAVEILSREDGMSRMVLKIQDYLSIGVQWIWLIDPDERQAILYSQQSPAGTVSAVLRTENPPIEIPLADGLR